jgi:hypothetical protein
MATLAVVDEGPLYATADADDVDHEASLGVLSRPDLRLIVAALAVAEATSFVGRRLGAAAESACHFTAVTPRHCDGFELLP